MYIYVLSLRKISLQCCNIFDFACSRGNDEDELDKRRKDDDGDGKMEHVPALQEIFAW